MPFSDAARSDVRPVNVQYAVQPCRIACKAVTMSFNLTTALVPRTVETSTCARRRGLWPGVLALAATLFATGAWAADITIQSTTVRNIHHLYLSPPGMDSWGEDL